MNCNTTHYRANSSSVPGDPTFLLIGLVLLLVGKVICLFFFKNDIANYQALVNWRSPAMTLAHSDKPTLYYFSTSGSGPCEQTQRAFSLPVIAGLVNKKFTPVALLSLDALQRKSLELLVVRKFRIHYVPALVVVSPAGKEIDRMIGAKEPIVIYEFLQSALRGRQFPLEDD